MRMVVRFQLRRSMLVIMRAVLAGVLMVMGMRITAVRVFMCVLVLVRMAVGVRVFVRVRHAIMRMFVDVSMRMRVFVGMGVLVFSLHGLPPSKGPAAELDAGSGAGAPAWFASQDKQPFLRMVAGCPGTHRPGVTRIIGSYYRSQSREGGRFLRATAGRTLSIPANIARHIASSRCWNGRRR